MKRYGYLYERICSIDNLILADKKARKGKMKQHGVKLFDLDREKLINDLHHVLLSKKFKTSEYRVFKINEGKEREIFQLPYYPDRIVHHAIMLQLEKIFVNSFTTDTYSCIKKRGIHNCLFRLTKSLRDKCGTQFCLKIDIKKFYPSVDNEILKSLLRKKFKDNDLLNILDEIVDSNQGLPIGNYLSQFFANFYLTYFDHWLKQEMGVRHYFRYCDDIVILGDSKESLTILLSKIKAYLNDNLKLKLSNHQIFPVNSRGIDFVGYVSFHTHIMLRKTIKNRFIRMIRHNRNKKSIASYHGWLLHCNSNNLRQKYLN